MAKIPFTINAKIVPERGHGKRFEIQRSRENIAWLINKDLAASFTSGNIAQPGGSGTKLVVDRSTGDDGFGTIVDIVAIKPQFGDEPDQITITGFVDTTLIGQSDGVPYPEATCISGNEFHTGPSSGARGWITSIQPTTANINLTKALKTALEAAVTDTTMTIIKMEVNGVRWGHGGYHFPQ